MVLRQTLNYHYINYFNISKKRTNEIQSSVQRINTKIIEAKSGRVYFDIVQERGDETNGL